MTTDLLTLAEAQIAEKQYKEIQSVKERLERDNFMRQQLYPWMPENALVSPHILYRLLETTRNTLFGKAKAVKTVSQTDFLPTATYQLVPSNILLSQQADNNSNTLKYYSFERNVCMELSGDYIRILSLASTPTTVKKIISILCSGSHITALEAKAFIRSLIDYGFMKSVVA